MNILSSDTNGEIFYISDKKDFQSIIKKLTKTKQIFNLFGDKSEKFKIRKEDYDFYSQLAKSLKPSNDNEIGLKCHLCQEEICPCCADINDTLQLCDGCGTAFHSCCVTNYTIQHNIGIPHIFRCPNSKCDILLKIDQDEIVAPFDDSAESTNKYIESEDESMNFDESTNDSDPEFVGADNPPLEAKNSLGTTKIGVSKQDGQTIRLGGFFGKSYTVKKENDKLIYERVVSTNTVEENNELDAERIDSKSPLNLKKPKIPKYWSPSDPSNKVNANRKRTTFLNCPGCGTQMKEKDISRQSCSYCGFKLDK